MNKFTDMFGKRKAVINFIDLDDNKKEIASSGELTGKKGEPIGFDAAAKINSLIDDGYVLVKNELANEAVFDEEEKTYTVAFKHAHQTVDAEHPAFGYDANQLQKKVKQIIHYEGAATRTPADSITEVIFNQTLLFDKVTGKAIKNEGWQPEKQNFLIIGTPTLPGFIPDKAVVGGTAVTPDDQDKEYTVQFNINREPSADDQNAVINYVDIANDNQLITSDRLVGQPNMPIEYDPKDKVEELKNKGYVLVNNGFNPNGEVEFFGNSTSYTPAFVITMKHTDVAVNAEHPNDNVDPYAYRRPVKFVVQFDGAGDATPEKIEQTAYWNRTITAVPATGQIVPNGEFDTQWQVDIKNFEDVKVPVVAGYHTDVKMVHAKQIGLEDDVQTITYKANGCLIPVDENGTAIENAPHPQFETNKNDPTQVMGDQIVPTIEGYTCELMTVTPHNPNKDLNVTYKAKDQKNVLVIPVGDENKNRPKDASVHMNQATEPAHKKSQAEIDADEIREAANRQAAKDEQERKENEARQAAQTNSNNSQQAQSVQNVQGEPVAAEQQRYNEPQAQVAIINFIDIDHNGMQLTSSGPLTGKPGESINDLYSTDIPLRAIQNAGYEVVFNNFDRDGFIQRFDNNDLMPQIFTIGVRKRRQDQPIPNQAQDASNQEDPKDQQ